MPAQPSPDGATPALAQWFAAKAAQPDALVFFRMGDFYELFFQDAEQAAAALDIALSFRGEHRGAPVPMCGVPAHAMEPYLARLIRRGFRVAICEQMETPEQAKARRATTIRREIVRVVTPGTVTEEALLEPGRPSWLLAIAGEGARLGAAWLDVSTGAFCTEALPRAELAALLARLEPAELLAAADLSLDGARPAEPPGDPARFLAQAFGVTTLEGFGTLSPPELAAAAIVLDYLRATQGEALRHVAPPRPQAERGRLAMDAATRRSLEILRNERGEPAHTLLAAVDRTLTAAGARELAARLASPLAEREAIAARHESVACLRGSDPLRTALRVTLKGAPDAARALARLSLDRFAPRDLAAIRDGLDRARRLAERLRAEALPPGGELAASLDALAAAGAPREVLARALAPDLPARLQDPGAIASGFDGELDALRRLRDDARAAIAALQLELAQAWGVASLKVRHHQQFGFLAEVQAAQGEKLLRTPPATEPRLGPVHRQTMASAHRFTCAALAELDRQLSEAGERAAAREQAILRHLCRLCLDAGPAIAAAAEALALCDVHAASAELASEPGWCRPDFAERAEFAIEAGRHPVVEAALRRARGPAFVANDADLSPGRRLCLLTGPNMAGKSTFLRQNALIVVLAQAGLPVPAARARLGLVDRLFSRVGAADDIAGGRSTFMVEMAETAAILNQASERSFVILDEVGRGTATWDGLAIAWSVLEALHDRIRCRAVFATHFRELTALAGKLPELGLATMRVREHRGEVVFQHLVGPGVADRSWGVQVARLAGVPAPVLARAAQILASLEERARGLDPLADELPLLAQPRPPQAAPPNALIAELDALDPDRMAPREALEAIYRLKLLRDADNPAKPPLSSAG